MATASGVAQAAVAATGAAITTAAAAVEVAEAEAWLKPFLADPMGMAHVHVLLTSRAPESEFGWLGSGARTLTLGTLALEDARLFLLRRTRCGLPVHIAEMR